MNHSYTQELLQEFLALRTAECALELTVLEGSKVQSKLLCCPEEELDALKRAETGHKLILSTDGVLAFYGENKINKLRWVDARPIPIRE